MTNQQNALLDYSIFTSFHGIQNRLSVSRPPLRSIIMRCHFDHKATSQRRELSTKSAVILPNSPNQEILILQYQEILGIPHTFTNQRDPIADVETHNPNKIHHLTNLETYFISKWSLKDEGG